jgi:foldase protein PrsA
MSRLPRIAMAAAVLSGMAVAPATAQEPRLPDGVVARVGDERISEREFRHWLRVAVRGEGQGGSAPLDPPRFQRCVAAELTMLGEQEPKPGRRELRKRCRDRYEALQTSTMLYLLHRTWTEREAAARGIVVTPVQVRRAFERQRRGSFPTERAYRRFLRTSGMTEADLLERLEFDMLQRRLTRTASANVPAVTNGEIERYYARHRRRFRDLSPASARRAIRVHLTSTRRQSAIARFLDEFRSRYRAITVCETGYVIDACSNAR